MKTFGKILKIGFVAATAVTITFAEPYVGLFGSYAGNDVSGTVLKESRKCKVWDYINKTRAVEYNIDNPYGGGVLVGHTFLKDGDFSLSVEGRWSRIVSGSSYHKL